MIMNAGKIQSWINCIGKTHAELLADSLIPHDELIELFPEIDELYLEPEMGVSMSFWRKTGCFEALSITLIKITPSSVIYRGALPSPYTHNMNQAAVRDLLGEPLESSGPIRLPQPVGQTGGWEYYQLNPELYSSIKVQFQYLVSMEVNCIVFTMIDKGRD